MVAEQVLATIARTEPLLPGVLVQRYKRFLSDIKLDSGETVVAHCVNTGAMEGLTVPGTRVWVSRSLNPKRKLGYTWELAEINGEILGVNTSLPNRIVHRLLQDRKLSWLSNWENIRPEKPYGEKSRVDFWLTSEDRQHFLEVKNCHLLYPDKCAYFPDCVSVRAAGHLAELADCIHHGGSSVTAEVLFFVQISGALSVRPSDLHDARFAQVSREVAMRGVRFSAIGVRHTADNLIIYGPIPVDLQPYDTSSHQQWRDANQVKNLLA